MGCIYKKCLTRPLPAHAEIVAHRGEFVARWQIARGERRTAKVITGCDGTRRISSRAKAYTARYRDAQGRMRDVPTGCRDKAAAKQVLARLETEAEKIRAGILTPAVVETATHAHRPISEHLEAYLEHLALKRVRGRKVSAHYRRNLRSRMERLVREGRLHRLADLDDTRMRLWLARAEKAGLAPATRNEYLVTARAFYNWAMATHRLATNPLTQVEKAEATSDARHKRRALTVEEMRRLLEAARKRPVAELGRERGWHAAQGTGRGKEGRWSKAPLTRDRLEAAYERGCDVLVDAPGKQARLRQIGRERALFYLVAVTTGLRKGEMASLTVGQVNLDNSEPYIELLARDSKSGKEALIPLRSDVAEQLRDHLADKTSEGPTFRKGPQRPGSSQPGNALLFPHPPSIRVFDRDLLAAGLAELDDTGAINKTDSRGRIIDIHALRHTFATHLTLAGVPPRVAQAALRHSRIELTMSLYTDPVLLDINEAISRLPKL